MNKNGLQKQSRENSQACGRFWKPLDLLPKLTFQANVANKGEKEKRKKGDLT